MKLYNSPFFNYWDPAFKHGRWYFMWFRGYISVGWIPGLEIDITFFYGRFYTSKNGSWFSESCWFWRYKSFCPIRLEFDFENFAQILKLRGLRPYAWVLFSQNHPMCISFYAGHFHMYNWGYLFDFISTHAISTPVILNFWSFFLFRTFFRSQQHP